MQSFIIGFLIFALCIILSRLLHEKGLAVLNEEQKNILLTELNHSRFYTFIPVLFFVASYYVLMLFLKIYSSYWVIGFSVLMFIYILILNISRYKKLKKVNLPNSYIVKHLIARTVQLLGLAFLLYIVAKDGIENI